MKRTLWVSIAGLCVLGGAFVLRSTAAPAREHSVSRRDRADVPASTPRPDPAPSTNPTAPVPDATAADAAVPGILSFAGALESELQSIKSLSERTPLSIEDRKRARALERLAQQRGRALAGELGAEPAQWPVFLDWLLERDDEGIAGRISLEVAAVLDQTARDILTERARSAPSPRARRIALRALAPATTALDLPSVLHAFQADGEPSVRRVALQTLTAHLQRPRSETERALVGEVLAARAAVEPDLEIRRESGTLLNRLRSAPGRAVKGKR